MITVYELMMMLQFRPLCHVCRLGPSDLTHKEQRSLQPRRKLSMSVVSP